MARTAVATATIAALVTAPFMLDQYLLFVLTLMLVYALSASGLTVLTGWTGQIALAHAGLLGVGAYGTALLHERGVPWAAALGITVVGCALIGLVVGLPSVRLRGLYLAVATLAFAELIIQALIEWRSVTRGATGMSVPPLEFFGLPRAAGVYYVAALLTVVCLVVVSWIGRRSWGRQFKAVRDMETAAAATGVPVVRVKVLAFMLSSALAGLGGGLMGQLLGFITPGTFHFALMIQMLVIVFLGGVGSTTGAVVGAVAVVALREWLQDVGTAQALAFGLLLLASVSFMPQGLVAGAETLLSRVRRRLAGRASEREIATARAAGDGDDTVVAAIARGRLSQPVEMDAGRPALCVRGLKVAFGGNVVLDGVNLEIRRGFTGILGPNGAGKTTLFNAITGAIPATYAALEVAGESVRHGWRPRHAAAAGVVRTFQTPRVIADLTVLENVMLSVDARRGMSPRAYKSRAGDLLHQFELGDWTHRSIEGLPLAMLKVVEVVRALVPNPTVVLLDEPAAGLNSEEVEDLINPLHDIVLEESLAVAIIEHDIEFVSRACTVAHVLHLGQIIASGPPADVLADQRVASAYLGVEHAGSA